MSSQNCAEQDLSYILGSPPAFWNRMNLSIKMKRQKLKIATCELYMEIHVGMHHTCGLLRGDIWQCSVSPSRFLDCISTCVIFCKLTGVGEPNWSEGGAAVWGGASRHRRKGRVSGQKLQGSCFLISHTLLRTPQTLPGGGDGDVTSPCVTGPGLGPVFPRLPPLRWTCHLAGPGAPGAFPAQRRTFSGSRVAPFLAGFRRPRGQGVLGAAAALF